MRRVTSKFHQTVPAARLRRRPGHRRGHVWSGPVHAVEFGNDATRPDQRQSLVRPVSNSTTRTRTRPDPTRPEPTIQSPRTWTPAQSQRTLSEIRVSEKVWSGPHSGILTLRRRCLCVAAAAAVDRYLSRRHGAQQQTRRRGVRMTGRTDGRTPSRFIDPAPHAMRSASVNECSK